MDYVEATWNMMDCRYEMIPYPNSQGMSPEVDWNENVQNVAFVERQSSWTVSVWLDSFWLTLPIIALVYSKGNSSKAWCADFQVGENRKMCCVYKLFAQIHWGECFCFLSQVVFSRISGLLWPSTVRSQLLTFTKRIAPRTRNTIISMVFHEIFRIRFCCRSSEVLMLKPWAGQTKNTVELSKNTCEQGPCIIIEK